MSGKVQPIADALEVQLPVGTRIRFLRELWEPASGDSPATLYAASGDTGVVTGHGCKEGHWVKWDQWEKAAFGARLGVDFEVVPPVIGKPRGRGEAEQ